MLKAGILAMETIILFILSLVALILASRSMNRVDSLRSRIEFLENILIEKKIFKKSQLSQPPLPTPSSQPVYIPVSKKISKPVVKVSPQKPVKLAPWIVWIRDNWTGASGIAILVLSVVFGGVYVGLSSSAFVRFMMILTFACAFLVGAFVLRKKTLWRDFSLWLQAAGGALILLACLGAGYFETLRFFSDPMIGLGLLVGGLGINVLLAFFSPHQVTSSFHVSLSLLALIFAPPIPPILWAATIVTMAGLALSFRSLWDWNVIGCTVAYSLFFYFWWQHNPDASLVRIASLSSAGLVGLMGILIPYGKLYKKSSYSLKTLFAHLLPWTTMGINLAFFSSGVYWAALPLAGASFGCFVLSRIALKNKIHWLYVCDTLIAQTLALMAITVMHRLMPQIEVLLWFAMIETLIFTTVMYIEKQEKLMIIGMTSLSIIVLGHISYISNAFAFKSQSVEVLSVMCLSSAALFYGIRWFTSDKLPQENSQKLFAATLDIGLFLYASFVLSFMGHLPTKTQEFWLIIVAFGVMAQNSKLVGLRGHRIALFLLILECLVISWKEISYPHLSYTHILSYTLPALFLLISLYPGRVLQSTSQSKIWLDDVWVYVLALHITLSSYLIFRPMSDFLPGILMIGFAIISFEISKIFDLLKNKSNRHLLLSRGLKNTSVLFLIVFALLHGTLYLQSEASLLDRLSLRFVFEILGVCTGLYLWFGFKGSQQDYLKAQGVWSAHYENWVRAIPVDLGLAFMVVFIALEFPTPWHPFLYSAVGLCLSYNLKFAPWPKRFFLYRVALLFTSSIYVGGVLSTWATPLEAWYYHSQVTGFLAMIMILILAYTLSIESKTQDKSAGMLKRFYQKDPILFSFVPPFLALATFFYWRFDHAILTTFWVGEVFLIVSFGFYVRHKRLVQIALTALFICLTRLIIYDLAQTDLLLRALIFAVVGGLMTSIHILYKKFSSRLK